MSVPYVIAVFVYLRLSHLAQLSGGRGSSVFIRVVEYWYSIIISNITSTGTVYSSGEFRDFRLNPKSFHEYWYSMIKQGGSWILRVLVQY